MSFAICVNLTLFLAQVHKPNEEDFQKSSEILGCPGRERSSKAGLGEYVDQAPPPQLESVQGWQFVDTEHGPGLVGYGNSATPAIAKFALSCPGESLDLEYLLSYEGMGAVRVVVDTVDIEPRVSTTVIIDALWDSRESFPWFQTIRLPESSSSIHVTIQVLPDENAMINGSALLPDNGVDEVNNRGPREFQILGIQCC